MQFHFLPSRGLVGDLPKAATAKIGSAASVAAPSIYNPSSAFPTKARHPRQYVALHAGSDFPPRNGQDFLNCKKIRSSAREIFSRRNAAILMQ